jgi:hypothetical protein
VRHPFRNLRRAFCTTLPSILGGGRNPSRAPIARCASPFSYGEQKANVIDFLLQGHAIGIQLFFFTEAELASLGWRAQAQAQCQ